MINVAERELDEDTKEAIMGKYDEMIKMCYEYCENSDKNLIKKIAKLFYQILPYRQLIEISEWELPCILVGYTPEGENKRGER